MLNPSEKISQLKIDRGTPAVAKRSWLLPGAALTIAGIAMVLWLLLGLRSATALVETDTARRPPGVAAAYSVLDASGYVVARRQATVSSKVTGKVIEVFVEEGMRVEKDQVLAKLDDTTEQALLSLAKAQAESSRATLKETETQLRLALVERERSRDLAKRALVSASNLDAAEADYDQLAARLEAGRVNVSVAERNVELSIDLLSNMTIKAPFSGMVVSKNAQPGEMISPVSAGGGFTRTGICTVIDTDSLEIEVDVNESYIHRVKPGQRVSATLDAYANWRIPAEVIAIVPTADRQKATVKVRIGFLQLDERVLRDMGAKVAFFGTDPPTGTTQEIQGVLIASEALRSDASGDFVWLVRNDVVEKRPVQIDGQRDRLQILVVNGLSVGDAIVRSSDAPLAIGQSIRTD